MIKSPEDVKKALRICLCSECSSECPCWELPATKCFTSLAAAAANYVRNKTANGEICRRKGSV